MKKNITLDPDIIEVLQGLESLTGFPMDAQINSALRIHIRIARLKPDIQKKIFKLLKSDN